MVASAVEIETSTGGVQSESGDIKIILGDARKELKSVPDNTFQCCITSPPYWGRKHTQLVGVFNG